MKTGKISNELGKTILETLGIENEKFCKVFNDYGTGGKMVDPHIVNVTGQVDKQKLKNYWKLLLVLIILWFMEWRDRKFIFGKCLKK